jgi:hypothetical protein
VPDAEARQSASSSDRTGGAPPTGSVNPFAAVLSGLSGLLQTQRAPVASTSEQPASTQDTQPRDLPQVDESSQGEGPASATALPPVTVGSDTTMASPTAQSGREVESTPQTPAPAPYASAIPSDYRETMRRREQDMRERRAQSRDQPDQE